MLRKIYIQNYALIRELELEFGSGLNIITGETGAGKSIIIGALGLILGNRADLGVLMDKHKKCIVEAVFDMPEALHGYFEAQDLDIEENLVIRRQINPAGKSRAFVNDTPVKLPLLKDICSSLIDVNTQFQTYRLNEPAEQLKLLDIYAGTTDLLKQYQSDYRNLKELQSRLIEIEERERKLKAERDFLQFQFDELEQAQLKAGEMVELEQELEIQSNAEEIKSNLFTAGSLLTSDESPVQAALFEAASLLKRIEDYHTAYKELSSRLQSVLVELQDLADSFATEAEEVDYNPQHLEEINKRLDLLNHLLQKHSLQTVDDLLALQNNIEAQLLSFEKIESDKDDLRKNIELYLDKTRKSADEISRLRRQVIPEVEKKVINKLAMLGMKSASFKIEVEDLPEAGISGKDRISFLFSANKGIAVAPMAKIASGGELSRLMLTLINVLSTRRSVASIVFDEIDSGVSGDVAGMVGQLMKQMGRNMQIIAITHLAQIAAKGDTHYKVYKYEKDDTTYSGIVRLSDEERVDEISLMISGKQKTEAARKTAKELME
jgi:DNA repair protein RecN (Recombination protein N)